MLALEAALALLDARTADHVAFTSAYLIAPLVLALFAAPRVIAAVGALSIALALASGAWNDYAFSGDHLVRVGVVSLATLLAVLSGRSRRGALEARAQTEGARRAADAARERLDGVMSLVTSDSRRELNASDLAFVEDLALRAGAAVENARLFGEQAHTAQTLQASLLPSRLLELARFRTASSYRAGGAGSSVGGDFYDLFTVDDGVMVLLGDVTGKGVDAAALTALVRYTAKTAARFDSRPSAVLRVVDEALREQASSLVTLVCAQLSDPEHDGAASVVLASGGHPLPLLVDRDGAVRSVGTEGLVLGAIEGGTWSDHRFALAPGETLLFYTDGATDAPGEGERFGEPRLELAAIGPGDPAALVARIDAAIDGFQDDREGDDRALLAIQYTPSAVGATPARR